MNMDYSKVFELLNQDVEKERNEKAEKAVHDNLYNKGFHDGLAVLDKIRAEIEQLSTTICTETRRIYIDADDFKENVLAIFDKYKAESEEI